MIIDHLLTARSRFVHEFPLLPTLAMACAQSACLEPTDIRCTTGVVPGIAVAVRDGQTGEPLASGALGVARDGHYADTLQVWALDEAGRVLWLAGVPERPGEYAVTISRGGFQQWDTAGVPVEMDPADQCHVKTTRLMAELEPRTDVRIEVRLGQICCFQDGDPQVTVPDTFTLGVPQTVTITTYGGGCERGGPTLATVSGLGATVVPFDTALVPLLPDHGCTRELRIFQHDAPLVFHQSGLARVTFIGRTGISGANDSTVLVHRDAVVR